MKDKELLPVVLVTKAKADKDMPGRFIPYQVVCASDNTEITGNLPTEWNEYIAEALNNYPLSKNDMPDAADTSLLNIITLPGEPMPGRLPDELKELRKNRKGLIRIQAQMPYRKPVWLSCVFYVTKGDRTFSLHEYLHGTVTDLIYIKLLRKGARAVFSYDGSKIVYTKDKPKTVIYVRGKAK